MRSRMGGNGYLPVSSIKGSITPGWYLNTPLSCRFLIGSSSSARVGRYPWLLSIPLSHSKRVDMTNLTVCCSVLVKVLSTCSVVISMNVSNSPEPEIRKVQGAIVCQVIIGI